MTDKTKIALSNKELELVCNTDWILTKHHIIKKVVEVLGELLVPMQHLTGINKFYLPTEIFDREPKISKGENYQLLPYVILDYPRYFGLKNTIAIRTMFWWGNFFSVSLQVAGDQKDKITITLLDNFTQLQQNNYWVCVNESPWQYCFAENNFVMLSTISKETFAMLLNNKPFIKISKKISLQHWDTVTLFVEQTFIEMINFLKISYLNNEKDL